MGKRTFLRTIMKMLNGAEFFFHVYEDRRKIYVVGDGDEEATSKPITADPGTLIVNDLIRTLFKRGNVEPGEHQSAAAC